MQGVKKKKKQDRYKNIWVQSNKPLHSDCKSDAFKRATNSWGILI